MKSEFKLVRTHTPEELERVVNELLQKGFYTSGNLVVTGLGTTPFLQPMVRYVNDLEPHLHPQHGDGQTTTGTPMPLQPEVIS